MKKVMILLVCMALLLSLCACGAEPEETVPPTAAPTTEATAPATEEAATVPPTEEEQPETTQPEETVSAEDMVELVRQYIDQPIEELYAVIGEPLSTDYAASCLGSGEDGLLIYEGFVVYTYREGDSEVVYDVE